MKKFYESPTVEFTVFDVEDVITVSYVNTASGSSQDIDAIINEIKSSEEYASQNLDVVGNYQTYSW